MPPKVLLPTVNERGSTGNNANIASLALTTILGSSATAAGGDMLQGLHKLTPGLQPVLSFFKEWLRIDISTLVLAITVLGSLPNAIKDLKDIALKIYWWLAKFLIASISISGNDCLNRDVVNWLSHNVLAKQATRILMASSESVHKDGWSSRRQPKQRDDFSGEKRIPIRYMPTFGTTWFVFERRVFLVRRLPVKSPNDAIASGLPVEFLATPEGNEPLFVMCLGRSVRPIKRFLEVCRDFSERQRSSFITVRTSRSEYYHQETWDTIILRPRRDLETVHFDEAVKADIVADMQNYLDPATRNFYNTRGIPYRRGYLLNGPPGTGKTSLSLALAGVFNLDLYLLHIPSVSEDRELERLFSLLPARCLVLLEDIDAVGLPSRHSRDDDDLDDQTKKDDDDKSDDDEDEDDVKIRTAKCSLSGLLNVLDGVASQEGRIVLMTSNFANKLDKALVRPGRIDRTVYLGFINHQSAKKMFIRMYAPPTTPDAAPFEDLNIDPETLSKLASSFADSIPHEKFTPAQLQGFLLRHRTSPRTAVDNVAAWAAEEILTAEHEKKRAKKAALRRKEARRRLKLAEAAVSLGFGKDAETSANGAGPTEETKENHVGKDKNAKDDTTQNTNGTETTQNGVNGKNPNVDKTLHQNGNSEVVKPQEIKSELNHVKDVKAVNGDSK